MKSDALQFLLGAVRRRIWLERTLRRLQHAFWIASLVLLALAIVSVFVIPISLYRATVIAAAAFTLALLSALTLRPSLKMAALRADRHFDGDALFGTALEVAPQVDHSPAASVVLRQAEDRAQRCRENLDSVWSAPPLSGFALTLVPIFAAVLLLPYSVMQGRSPVLSDPSSAAQASPEYVLNDAEALRELRGSIARSSARPDRQAAASGSDRTSITGTRDSGESHEQAAPGDSSAAAAVAEGGGREAGDGTPGSTRIQPDRRAHTFAEHSVFELARRGEAVAGSGATGRQFAQYEEIADSISAAVAPASFSAGSTLSPAQVAHARRYLESTESSRD